MQWKGLAVIATVLLIAFGMALGNRFYQNQEGLVLPWRIGGSPTP